MFDDFFEILAEDNELIIIRKSILKICDDDMIATAILSKSIYYSKISKFDDRRFYKFKEPCDETNGDSWCEILGLKNKYKFDKALTILKDKNFIKTKTDMSRKTYYFLNFGEIKKAINNYNTLTNEQKQPVKAKTEPKEYKDTTEQEKQLKTQDLKPNTEKTEKPKEKKPVFDMRSVELPNFISPQVWLKYCDYKSERKEKLTQTGIQAKFSEWKKWHDEGVNINECIETAMANEWRGVFKPTKKVIKNQQDTLEFGDIAEYAKNFNLGYNERFASEAEKAIYQMHEQVQRGENGN